MGQNSLFQGDFALASDSSGDGDRVFKGESGVLRWEWGIFLSWGVEVVQEEEYGYNSALISATYPPYPARVVKLVDAGDSKSPAARRAGSIPAPGTTTKYP